VTLEPVAPETEAPNVGGPRFEEVVEMWQAARWKIFAESTRRLYVKLLRYLEYFRGMYARSITPAVIDEWLRHMTSEKVVSKQHSTRENYRHELEVLSGILRYYSEYHDDPSFVFPIKRRHHEAAIVRKVRNKRKDPMTPEQFEAWASSLRGQEEGLLKEALARTQRSGALRISEAAAIHWDDINWEKRFVTIRRAVIWGRGKEVEPFIQNGFKNGDKKEVPLTPDAYRALKGLSLTRTSELVFHQDGKLLEYRFIQYAYNRGFKLASLPFRGTHVMRRTGTSWVLDNSGGDVGLAKQILGNADWGTVDLYAKRQALALKEFNDKLWKEEEMGELTR
jgi:integrase